EQLGGHRTVEHRLRILRGGFPEKPGAHPVQYRKVEIDEVQSEEREHSRPQERRLVKVRVLFPRLVAKTGMHRDANVVRESRRKVTFHSDRAIPDDQIGGTRSPERRELSENRIRNLVWRGLEHPSRLGTTPSEHLSNLPRGDQERVHSREHGAV